MRVIVGYPPMYEAIARAFKPGPGVIYAWGDAIYNPSGQPLTPELLAHEAVHGGQQGNAVEFWWQRYLGDADFRLAQEIPAHAAEYASLVAQHGGSRFVRRRFLDFVARKLAAPLYGLQMSVGEAKLYLREELACGP